MASLAPLLTTLLGFSVATAETRLAVEWDGTRLGLTAEKVPLPDVLREIARRTGIEFLGLEELREEVSVDFASLSLLEALRRLLASTNYMVWERGKPGGGLRPALVLVFPRNRAPGHPIGGQAIIVQQVAKSAGKGAEEDKLERIKALQDSAQTGDEDALRRGLSDPNPIVQAFALELLAAQQGEKAIPLLLERAKSDQPSMRFRALDILNGAPDADEQTVLDALTRAVLDEDAQVKKYAIGALADRGGPHAVAQLQQALRDADPAVRMVAIDNIVRSVPPAERIPMLREAASDANEEVRSVASTWLEQAVVEARSQ